MSERKHTDDGGGFKTFGIVVVVIGFLGVGLSLLLASQSEPGSEVGVGLVVSVSLMLSGVLWYAIGKALQLLSCIEINTRKDSVIAGS
jgi:hypothetical protein